MIPDADSAFGVRVFFFTKSHQRRDLDNMLKLVCDACTGIVWKDDSQVIEVYARCYRADEKPRTELVISTLPATATPPTIKCEICGKSKRIYPSHSGRKYCSRKCQIVAFQNGIDVPCAGCGTIIHRADHRLREKSRKFYCSSECRHLHLTIELNCEKCGIVFRKPKCIGRKGRALCSDECRIAFFAEKPTKKARGACSFCGGPVSRPEYTRCNGCRIKSMHKS
jgi:endogenous inhibitor of DNA gyrase (YacG/DUF329 family)